MRDPTDGQAQPGIVIRRAESGDAVALGDLARSIGAEPGAWLLTTDSWREAGDERRYLKAVQRGMQFGIDHPDEAVEILAKFPGQIEDAKKLAWRFKLQNPLFQSDYSNKNGPLTMDPEVWSEMIGVMVIVSPAQV